MNITRANKDDFKYYKANIAEEDIDFDPQDFSYGSFFIFISLKAIQAGDIKTLKRHLHVYKNTNDNALVSLISACLSLCRDRNKGDGINNIDMSVELILDKMHNPLASLTRIDNTVSIPFDQIFSWRTFELIVGCGLNLTKYTNVYLQYNEAFALNIINFYNILHIDPEVEKGLYKRGPRIIFMLCSKGFARINELVKTVDVRFLI